MKARRAERLAERSWDDDPATRASIEKGDFEIATDEKTGQRWFWFKCPGACGTVAPIALRPVTSAQGRPSWDLSGSDDAPTLQPSINHVGCWHGWLTAGEFTSC